MSRGFLNRVPKFDSWRGHWIALYFAPVKRRSATGMATGTTEGGGGSAVLEDPRGRRARWLRRAGRAVFLLFLAWLLAIMLGGLGLIPVAPIPFTHVLRPSQGPPALTKLPKPRPPSTSGLRPAVPAQGSAAK